MKDTVRLGRLGGVTVGLNWSLVVIAALLAYVLAQNRFPADAPGYASSEYAATAVVTALGLLVTVLAHELGHALVARRANLGVDGITLSWIGGITRIEGEASTPGVEAAIAGIGPLISLVCGSALWVLRLGLSSAGAGRLAVAALGWLAVINVVLALFNLLPASPLDGGRILHATAWKLTGDRWRAGRLASATGIGLGTLVLAAAAFEATSGSGGASTFNALITAMLGWWLITTARSERQVAAVHHALQGCRCADVMRPVLAGPGWVTVATFLAGYPDGGAGPSPVWLLEGWGDNGYVGVVTTEELRAMPAGEATIKRPIDVAVPVADAAGARPDDDVLDVLTAGAGARVVLVIDGGRTVGAIVPGDVASWVHDGRRHAPELVPAEGAGVGT